MLKPQPYKLKNAIQHYEWGTKGKNAFIPKLLNIKAEISKPYAELWMGAHPKASSKIVIDGKEIELLKVIQKYPIEMLGNRTAQKYSNTLPFLFKVLSANEALSIQVHPSKHQAIVLHKKDPVNYPDANQKHEIALGSLTALVGLKPTAQIKSVLKQYPEIQKFIWKTKNSVKNVITSLIKKSLSDREGLGQTIRNLNFRISKKKIKTEIEKHFLKLYKKYGNDVGLLLLFFMNYVHLKKGEAIFTSPGIPHAYLKGNIFECMSNSDNVIRAGLTTKHKDIYSLLDVLRFETHLPQIIKGKKKGNSIIYQTEAKEFQLAVFNLKKDELKIDNHSEPKILLVLSGSIEIGFSGVRKLKFSKFLKGESVFLPASLTGFAIRSQKPAKFVMVSIPVKY